MPIGSKATNNFSQFNATSMMQSKIIFGKYDEELYKKESEKEHRIERIKAVRMQERGAAQISVMEYHNQLKQKEQEAE